MYLDDRKYKYQAKKLTVNVIQHDAKDIKRTEEFLKHCHVKYVVNDNYEITIVQENAVYFLKDKNYIAVYYPNIVNVYTESTFKLTHVKIK